ncbi:MAG TPA: prolipoprotein diacylglyceryl transferase [Candidatus Omnitrophota bacterium]|nr:prolipoprotein diacylglyceryl transferase [Candidatus Omnitrophota bacterium]HPD84022.1 prolipoprotein diacylglyceryl transferase [Candidatus Omnitrophota bacterium]HRZ02879.1 prolipoprotein diacylglyceryl transferase [Candidatus Omnitrophota bacterium]
MHPVICQIGPLTVYSYGAMLAVAVVVCSFLLQRAAKARGFNPDIIFDLVFWSVVSGIIGSRIFFIFLNLTYFVERPSEIVMLQHGGLAWQGGLIAGTLTAIIFFKRKKLPIAQTVDFVAPYVALGQAIGRIGCFLNGCCYGSEAAWGIYFPVHEAKLHPTQLYDALGLLVIFLILKKYETIRKTPGEVFCLYLFLASLQRFAVEFFRADHSIVWLGLSIFQIVSIGIMAVSLYAYSFLKSRFPK